MRVLVLTLLMAVTSTLGGTVSAGKKTPTDTDKIIGTWKATIADKKDRIEFGIFTFREDGKFTLERDHFLDLAKGTYAANGDGLKITVTYAVDGAPMDKGGPWPVKVKSRSDKEIVLELKGENSTALVYLSRMPISEGAWKAVEEDRKKIQGSWEHVKSEENGKEIKDKEASGTMTFTGEKVVVKGEKEYGIFTLNANRKLKAIQFRWSDGKGIANLGAYQLNGDTLRICSEPGGFPGFPKEFKTEGTKNRIDEFKRVKK